MSPFLHRAAVALLLLLPFILFPKNEPLDKLAARLLHKPSKF